MRGASGRQLDARILGEFHDVTRRALWRLERDEVTALRRRPCGGARRSEVLLEEIHDAPEFRRQNFTVPIHQRVNTRGSLQQTQVTQLVDLVAADRLYPHPFEEPSDIV